MKQNCIEKNFEGKITFLHTLTDKYLSLVVKVLLLCHHSCYSILYSSIQDKLASLSSLNFISRLWVFRCDLFVFWTFEITVPIQFPSLNRQCHMTEYNAVGDNRGM